MIATITAKAALPQLPSICIDAHDPEILAAVVRARFVPSRPRCRRAAEDESAIECRLQAVKLVRTISAEGDVPNLISTSVQSKKPKVGSSVIGGLLRRASW